MTEIEQPKEVATYIEDYPNKIDFAHDIIDELNEKELHELIKYIEEQLLLVEIAECRKEKMRNELRRERIKMAKELTIEKKKHNKKINREDSSEESPKKIYKKKK
jgi:hypothetical protein